MFPVVPHSYLNCIIFSTIVIWRWYNGNNKLINQNVWFVKNDKKKKKTAKLRIIGFCEGNSSVTGEFPAQGPVTRERFPFDDVIMNLMIDS